MQICCFRIFFDSYNTFQQMPSAAGPALHGRESDPPSVGDGRFCTGFSDPDFRPTIRAISPRQNQELPRFNKNFPNQIFSQTKAVNFLKQFFTQTKTVTFLIHEIFW